MNPLISLRPHQKDVVAKSIFHGNTLAAHTVGAGKTFSAIAAIMESKRLGLSSKAMIAVPNHLTEQWGRDFLKLYPDAKVLVATKKDFEKKNRHKLMAKIASGNYDAVIVGHSQFGMIPVSQEYEKRFLQEQLKELDLKLNSCNKYTQGFSVKQLQQKKKKLESKIKALMKEKRRDDIVNFEEMGIDKLVVDEAHEFKNLQIPTSLTGVSGISNSASQKAYDLYMKTKYLDEKTGRKGLLFLTGTPVSNSMCELFVMQKYLNNEDLVRTGLLDFDAWASTFGEIKNVLELSVDGTSYKMKTKFNRFNNMPELKKQFLNFADIKMPESLDLPVPDLKSEVVKVKPSELQKEIIEDLSSRADKVKSGIDPRIDNMLKITNDGRKLALDQRVFDPMLPDEDNSKVNACVDKIVEIYNQTMDSKSTQIVFSDLSVPNKDEFNVHHDLKEKLIKKGLKSQEIAFIHDANTPAEKEKLFAKVRSGDVRVIIGTTQKMGTGTNMQDRAIALHHLDCPWRPADREQRLGRMVRQGNENKEVFEYTYITEGTFDAYMYQILENKQRFISQLMTEESALRSIEDVDEITLNYAEIKALCANNPLIKEKMELENDVNRLSIEKAGYLQNINQLKNQIANVYPETMKKLENNMNVINKDLERARRSENKPFEIKINGNVYKDEKEAAKAFIESYQGSIKKTTPFAEYEGFKIFIDYSSIDKQYILNIAGEERNYKELASKAGHWNITRIKNMTSPEYFKELINSTEERLKEQQRNLETAKEEVLKPFINEEEYVEKMNRLTEINLKFNDGDISFDQSLEEAKEKLSDFCIASQGYSDIDFTDLGDVHLMTKKIDGQRKIDISCNLLDQPELITKLNGEIIDIRREQSLEDFIKLNITSLDLSQHIHKLKETGKLELSEKTNKEVTKHDRFEDRDDR
ncbi:SNF2-related protein [Aedoeadaptatus coli]